MRKRIRRFRGMEEYTDAQIAYNEPEFVANSVEVDQLSDKVLETVFAPDPVTGWPTSSLSLLINDKTPQEIKDYLNQHIRIATPVHDSMDESSLMETIQLAPRVNQYGEERERSLNGLRDMISRYFNTESDD